MRVSVSDQTYRPDHFPVYFNISVKKTSMSKVIQTEDCEEKLSKFHQGVEKSIFDNFSYKSL